MTSNVVFRLQCKKTKQFLVNIDTSGHPTISFSPNVGSIYYNPQQFEKLYARVEAAKNQIKIETALIKASPVASSNISFVRSDRLKLLKKCIRRFEQCELKTYAILEQPSQIIEHAAMQDAIDMAKIHTQFDCELVKFADNEYATQSLGNAFRNWERIEENKEQYKIILLVNEPRERTEKWFKDHGIAFVPLESYKNKAYALKSKKDLNYIMLINKTLLLNHIEIGKMNRLLSKLTKKYKTKSVSK